MDTWIKVQDRLLKWLSGKESAFHAGDAETTWRFFFSPWVWKIPWRRNGSSPYNHIVPGKPGQRSLVGYNPCGHKKFDTAEAAGHITQLLFSAQGYTGRLVLAYIHYYVVRKIP